MDANPGRLDREREREGRSLQESSVCLHLQIDWRSLTWYLRKEWQVR